MLAIFFFVSLDRKKKLLKEQTVIHKGCSLQKSDGSDSLFFKSKSLFRSQKASESLEKPMSEFQTLAHYRMLGDIPPKHKTVFWTPAEYSKLI